MAVKAFPKGKGRFQLELQRRSWAPPDSDPSVLVATHQAFEHSITDVLLRSLRRRARLKQYKRLQRAADVLAETDTRNLEAFFRRPTTGILRLPTCAGANLRADRTLASDELEHELPISRSRCLFRPTRVLAFAFKRDPSLSTSSMAAPSSSSTPSPSFKRTLAHFKRTLAHFLKHAFVLAFELAFTLKLILVLKLMITFLKSNLGLKLILVLKLILAFLKLILTLSRTTPTR
ncbi:hypothetical protein FB107DRAFT_273031 [Schizophyllum commune]